MSKAKRMSPTSEVGKATEPMVSGNRESKSSQTPDPEVLAKPKRRTFTAAYKADILRQADACAPGQLGALLRSEGLYSSHLSKWRRQRERGAQAGLQPKKRGRKEDRNKHLLAEVERLRRANQRLEDELCKARAIIDIQKKVALLLGVPETTEATDESEVQS